MTKGINLLTGVIPVCGIWGFYDPDELFTVKKPIDHNTVSKGIPLGQKGSKVRDYSPIQIVIGSIYKKEKMPGDHPSYNNIGNETKLGYLEDSPIATIENNQVFLNGVKIASAPSHLTKSKKLTFCKAIVWGLLNDHTTLSDKLKEITPTQDTTPAITPGTQYPYPVGPVMPGYVPHLKVIIQEVPA